MMEYLRQYLTPLVNFLAKPLTVFHPNVVSFLSILIGLPGFYFISQGDSLLGSLFILGAISDAFDGAVARMTGKTSKFGGILDATIDRFFEGLFFMSLAAGELVSVELAFIAFNVSVCISYIKAKAEATVGQSTVGKNEFSVGIAQRGDRLAIMFFGLLLNGIFTSDSNDILLGSVLVLLITALITLVWRGILIYKVVEK
jgi:archaetidylinositol phosphate synthase